MSCGIYKITNLINQKIYIGQSVDIKKRFREHKFAALHHENKDHSMPIHLAMYKYGCDNFQLDIIEECSKDELNDREIYWIQYFDSYNKGYNANLGGDSNFQHLGVPIEAYDFQGNYVITYPSVTIAADDIGVSRNTIYNILYGKRLSAKGLQFKRVDDNKPITPYKSNQGGKKEIYQLDLDNNIIKKWDSIAEAAKELKIDSSSISKVCQGKNKTCGGYK